MYKCNECGTEYKIKPEYCDCGNDEFTEIVSEKKSIVKNKTSFLKTHNISPFALIFFIFCLILSVLVLLFFANPKEQNSTQEQHKNIVKEKHYIPNIDTFWNNTPVKKEETKTIAQPKQEIVEVVQIIEKPKPVIQNNSSKVQKQITKKVTQQTSKPKQTTINKTTQQTQTKTNNVTNTREVYNYKIRLRNALFSHLQAGAIQGKGKCGIEFSVNQYGKLINRAFTFQSDNKSLNDEVYKMMMRMPTYSPPPSGYKGEKIKITFDFDNGDYEVHLVN